MFMKRKEVEQAIVAAVKKAQDSIDRATQQFIEEQRGHARSLIGKVQAYMGNLDETNLALRQLAAKVEALEARLSNMEKRGEKC